MQLNKYPFKSYEFPPDVPLIHKVKITNKYVRINLVDGRNLDVPINWFPFLFNATKNERNAFVINRSREYIEWPALNNELFVYYYLYSLDHVNKLELT